MSKKALLLEQIRKDFDEFKISRQMSIGELSWLGYSCSARYIDLGSKMGYNIAEVIDQDTKKPVSFCFVYTEKQQAGFILPKPFSFYVNLV